MENAGHGGGMILFQVPGSRRFLQPTKLRLLSRQSKEVVAGVMMNRFTPTHTPSAPLVPSYAHTSPQHTHSLAPPTHPNQPLRHTIHTSTPRDMWFEFC